MGKETESKTVSRQKEKLAKMKHVAKESKAKAAQRESITMKLSKVATKELAKARVTQMKVHKRMDLESGLGYAPPSKKYNEVKIKKTLKDVDTRKKVLKQDERQEKQDVVEAKRAAEKADQLADNEVEEERLRVRARKKKAKAEMKLKLEDAKARAAKQEASLPVAAKAAAEDVRQDAADKAKASAKKLVKKEKRKAKKAQKKLEKAKKKMKKAAKAGDKKKLKKAQKKIKGAKAAKKIASKAAKVASGPARQDMKKANAAKKKFAEAEKEMRETEAASQKRADKIKKQADFEEDNLRNKVHDAEDALRKAKLWAKKATGRAKDVLDSKHLHKVVNRKKVLHEAAEDQLDAQENVRRLRINLVRNERKMKRRVQRIKKRTKARVSRKRKKLRMAMSLLKKDEAKLQADGVKGTSSSRAQLRAQLA